MTQAGSGANLNLNPDQERKLAASQPAPADRSSVEYGTMPEMPPPLASAKKNVWDLAKTSLDPEACKRVISQMLSTASAKRSQQAQELQIKPSTQLKRFKKASPCSSMWDGMDGTDKVRFCQKCMQRVYNFDSLDEAKSEALAFQMEGRHNILFYQRGDGTFLTKDCPVGAANRRNILLAEVASTLLVFGLITFFLLSVPTKLPTVKSVSKTSQPQVPASPQVSPIVKVPATVLIFTKPTAHRTIQAPTVLQPGQPSPATPASTVARPLAPVQMPEKRQASSATQSPAAGQAPAAPAFNDSEQ